MAVRVSHTNNSSGHDGTYVYRSTSPMDPQNLPAPIADAPPVALGATFEYIESPADGTYYYRTQDHEGEQVSAVSGEVPIIVGEDYASAQLGDEIGGGIYAGINTESDGTQYHIIFSKADGDLPPGPDSRWKITNTATVGADSNADGWANTQAIVAAGLSDHPAALHCRLYRGGGFEDWHLPARSELSLEANLRGHPELALDDNYTRWTSAQEDAATAYAIRFTDGLEYTYLKDNEGRRVRPVRRVPV